ncbi:bifunctional 5,10-methylenetetrahydrofolate dehydrogenase/5,10-methenyltetrahydrofolate cyclohydrolase [Sphingobium fuliginis]|uniref:Bifunctional protein FolD n=1 Tax=Sphingobium fuliginis ATCC 27551 TaxID=1208342 RepID=A0A5B8CJ07_SPHSA|nr:tetrahydrofolate dehydrogenase/cyclohydrolase catalytic domain-containing protein [Sphingobium fuliginis]QDC39654.1 bifunctional methylenetetrahydrofolate dehydrogenase/methenyltetrahydrofolate cyclohydrolase [Sphingobium fuliginis ATCC 27551]
MARGPSCSGVEIAVHIINGRAKAAQIEEVTHTRVEALKLRGVEPALAVILAGDDPASQVYVRRKIASCARTGIRSIEYRLAASAGEEEVLDLVDRLNRDGAIHGILVQLPLPPVISANRVMDAIRPDKDVDGFHPVNVGRLSTGGRGLVPCTPLGIMKLLDGLITDYRGLDAVVIGKSNIVGKPVAMLLLEREATVTITHIETRDLPAIVRRADIVVAAAGAPGLVRGDWVKPGAVVIDVGITRVDVPDGRTRLIGDCRIDEMDHARAVTPVPGGVGPMTIACLLANTLTAAERAADG